LIRRNAEVFIYIRVAKLLQPRRIVAARLPQRFPLSGVRV
jgi:hypothetical protein